MSLISNKRNLDINRVGNPFLSIFIYVALINASVAFATVAFHEAGHYTLGHFLGCSGIEITLFDNTGGAYTEMSCPPSANIAVLALGGSLFVIPFGLILFLLRFPERRSWVIAIGFNLIISYADIAMVTNMLMIPAFLTISGIAMFITGQSTLINNFVYKRVEKLAEPSENTPF